MPIICYTDLGSIHLGFFSGGEVTFKVSVNKHSYYNPILPYFAHSLPKWVKTHTQ